MCDGCPPSAEHIYSRAVLTGNVPGKKTSRRMEDSQLNQNTAKI